MSTAHCGLRLARGLGCVSDISTTTATRPVIVWNDTVDAHDAGDAAAAWFSDVLARECRLVARRVVSSSTKGEIRRSARSLNASRRVFRRSSLLVLGQASVDALSERIVEQGGEAVISARFRPNILLSHTTPHEEDSWQAIRIGDMTFEFGERDVALRDDDDRSAYRRWWRRAAENARDVSA